MAATLAYLREWGWTTGSLYSWTRHETAYMTEAHIDMRAEWWVVEEVVLKEAQRRRHRFANKKNCQRLVSGTDWTVAHKAMKKLSKATSDPGTKHYKHGDKTRPCPLCNVPATPKHILWLCKWRQGQRPHPMD